jgi:hypothetical protein
LFDSSKDQQLDFIAILETKRNDFTASELAHFCANKNYPWNWSPTRGRSGGILLGANLDNFDVQSVCLGSFHVKLQLRNKLRQFRMDASGCLWSSSRGREKHFLTGACTNM